MPDEFTPLLPAAKGSSLLNNAGRIKTAFNPIVSRASAQVPSPAPPGPSSPPEISVQRDGGRITQIQIRCSCGETITLDCEYSDKTASGAG